MDALENPARARIQEEMNKINVERFIKKNIPTFEKMSKKNADINLSDFHFWLKKKNLSVEPNR